MKYFQLLNYKSVLAVSYAGFLNFHIYKMMSNDINKNVKIK